jgi:hypothetical protein
MNMSKGHRERLRQRFSENPHLLSDTERLELLLTYAIPRRDVAPLARELIANFGSLEGVITAPIERITEINGVGESTVTFLQLLKTISGDDLETQIKKSTVKQDTSSPQLTLFKEETDIEKPKATSQEIDKHSKTKIRKMRVFADDEIANSLTFLPHAEDFPTIERFKKYLHEKLPYNASKTRIRRAAYILDRFIPEGELNTPLTYYAAYCSAKSDLQPVVFYHVLKAEPIAVRMAEDLIWPALPLGKVQREQVHELISRNIPQANHKSVKKIFSSLAHTYELTGIATVDRNGFHFQFHQGSLESFLYLLTCEFPKAGIYSFDRLFNSPLHRWLLWDRDWMRNQLYNLQDVGIISKISEIDNMRQFTLSVDQPTALKQFFEHPARKEMAIREDKNEEGEVWED